MCITYQDNGMKPGDIVYFGGGYIRLNDDQIQLDSCLAGTAASFGGDQGGLRGLGILNARWL